MIAPITRFCLALVWPIAMACGQATALDGPNLDWSVQVWPSKILKSREVHGLAQTPDGYLWVGTPRRILRFDGTRFEEYPPVAFGAAATARIVRLTGSSDGGLWIALDNGGLVHATAGRREAVAIPPKTPSGLDALIEDDAGAAWVAQNHGPVFRVQAGRVTAYGPDAGVGEGTCGLACDQRGRVWLAQDGTISVFRDERFERVLQLPKVMTRIARANDGGLWIWSGHDLIKLAENGEQRSVVRDEKSVHPAAMLEDRSGVLWLSSFEEGLLRYGDGRLQPVPTSHRRIEHLLEDSEGNLWVGTTGGGLDRVQPRVITVEGAASGLPLGALQTLTEDRDGRLWAATGDGSVLLRTGDRWSVAPGTGSLHAATCLAADGQGALWIGTSHRQLHRLDQDRLTTWTPKEGLESRIALALLASRSGDVWIVGTAPPSVQCLHDGKLRSLRLPRALLNPSRITEDAAGQIWIGTRQGVLLRVQGEEAVAEPAAKPARLKQIASLHPTEDGSLWIGYEGSGVGWLKDGRFVAVREEHGLADNYIAEIVDDGRGWLWFGGVNRGVFKVQRREFEAFATGRVSRVQSMLYGAGDGVPALVDPGGVLRTRDGRLWMIMGTALVIANPASTCDFLAPSPVRITRCLLDEKPWSLDSSVMPPVTPDGQTLLRLPGGGSPLRIAPDHRKIEFEFACLSFGAPENVRFRHRLAGFEDGWVETGARSSVGYSRLPPATYRFEVQACNSAGVWNPMAAGLDVIVVPFFWQTWWFETAALALFATAVFFAARFITTPRLRALQEEAALARERTRIARDIHDDVGNRLTQILLFTGLAQQDSDNPPKAAEHLRQIAASTVEVTNVLDEIVWAVNPRNDTLTDLVGYLGNFAVEFLRPAGIRCEVDMPAHPITRPVPADVRHNLFLVTKEALHNIVRHAGATEVRFGIMVSTDAVAVSIVDNGRGFAGESDDATSDGLRNMRARMQEIAGFCEFTSAPGRGTRVTFGFHRCP